jgi:flagellar biosynthesis component FlhA
MTSGGRDPGYTRQNYSVITNARIATSEEMAGRVKRYSITMAFRTACFIAMIFVPGVGRWILFACAVFLPYVAVLLANQAHQRSSDRAV